MPDKVDFLFDIVGIQLTYMYNPKRNVCVFIFWKLLLPFHKWVPSVLWTPELLPRRRLWLHFITNSDSPGDQNILKNQESGHIPILPFLHGTVQKREYDTAQSGKFPIQALTVYTEKVDLFKLTLNPFFFPVWQHFVLIFLSENCSLIDFLFCHLLHIEC